MFDHWRVCSIVSQCRVLWGILIRPGIQESGGILYIYCKVVTPQL